MITTIGSALIITKIADNILGGKNATTNSAIPIAISKISGIDVDSVFWVLDSANNAIKYREKVDPNVPVFTCSRYWNGSNISGTPDYIYNIIGKSYPGGYTVKSSSDGNYVMYNPSYGSIANCQSTTAQPKPYNTIPIPSVADKIYDNAKTGDNTSMLAVNEAVNNLISTGQLDVLLNNHIKSS